MYYIDSYNIIDTNRRAPSARKAWAAVHIGLTKLKYKGRGQKVGILDTGCDTAHPDLTHIKTHDYITYDNAARYNDLTHAHGTFITGQIAASGSSEGLVGAAPEAEAYHARVLYGTPIDTYRVNIAKDLANAIRGCVDEGCGVLNISLGGMTRSPTVITAIRYAIEHGVIIVAAAGNERLAGSMYASFPAAYTKVISVASANQHDMPAWFSTIGMNDTSKLAQPEVAIANLPYYWGCLPGGTYGRMTGTSMAAPIVSATALLWREARIAKNELPVGECVLNAFRAWLHQVVNDTNKNGWDSELGFGVLKLDQKEIDNF